MSDFLPATIPSYALAASATDRSLNADALAGISTGFPPSIRIKASKFRIVDGNGAETVLKASQLADNEFLPVVVLKPRAGMNKVYYAAAFDPNQAEASPPDCFSLDGEKPDPSVAKPICANCHACPMNAFGSGRNQAGQPTKGKACADNKILAVLYNGGVYQFKIPPASLKNWGLFVKKLDSHNVNIGAVITYIGFDDATDYSVLTFHATGFVKEEQLGKLEQIRASQEVAEIVGRTSVAAAAPARVAIPERPAPKPEPEAPVVSKAPVIDLFGDSGAVEVETAKPPVRKPRAAKAADEAPGSAVPTDEEIIAEMDL